MKTHPMVTETEKHLPCSSILVDTLFNPHPIVHLTAGFLYLHDNDYDFFFSLPERRTL